MDILCSAQHWNQHKDAFVRIFYRDPCCSKPDKMYTSQWATAWHFSCSILRDLICRVYPSVNDVSVCYLHFWETKTPTPLFKQHMTKAINQYNFYKVRLTGSTFLTNALLLRLNNNQSIRAARWNAYSIVFQPSYPFCRSLSIHARQEVIRVCSVGRAQ